MRKLGEPLTLKISDQNAQIAHNAKYLREQQQLIDTTIEAGQNYIAQLTAEADELEDLIYRKKTELILIGQQLDNRRIELAELL